jgi:hypothetical protein
MKRFLSILIAGLIPAFFMPTQAQIPGLYRTVVSLQVLCSRGGPALIMDELLKSYNEKPVHAMDLRSQGGVDIQMYITENKNNPSSSLLLHNRNPAVNQTCIFWTAEDTLKTIETESLPAKKPEEKADA